MSRGFISTITQRPSLVWGVVLMILLVLSQWAVVAIFMWQLPPEIPMWYSLPPGKQQLTQVEWFWMLPIMGLVLLVINILLLKISLNLLSVFKYLVVWLGVLVEMLLTIAMVHIVMMAL